ncbi:hypothetical protein JOF35_003803 [Streptomyces demainii]|uniref:Uncharacterized protein n=1 Tax=Streptomyces demainii TaxID=588122 RepID=A0ABT9KVX7_9ACTN|nr:hypothetical protein [Streptomyces demainii]
MARARVYKDGGTWTWTHLCPWEAGAVHGLSYFSQRIAFMYALAHVKRCL